MFIDLINEENCYWDEDDFEYIRPVVVEHLFKHNVLRAEIKFSGEDGQDSIDEVMLYFIDGTMLRINGGGNYGCIEKALSTPVYSENQFESIEHINGKVIWTIDKEDAKKSTVKIESTEYYETYEEVSKEL